jgi:hypothetical protein
MLRIASFDIGKKNFAFVVQEFDTHELELAKTKDKLYLDPRTFINMTDTLDEYKDIWDTCSVFVIEQQMSFGKKRNTMALKLGQHCYSYFSIFYRDFKKVIEFPSYHKTQMLDAPKKFGSIKKTYKNGKSKMIKDNHKKWSIRLATRILEMKNDLEHLEILSKMKKKDDVSDCLLMIYAYILLTRKN